MAGCRGSQRTAAARFSYEGSSPDCHRARRPHPGILRPLSFPVERPPQPPAGAAWVCPTRRPHTPTYAADGGFQSVIPAASAAWPPRRRPVRVSDEPQLLASGQGGGDVQRSADALKITFQRAHLDMVHVARPDDAYPLLADPRTCASRFRVTCSDLRASLSS